MSANKPVVGNGIDIRTVQGIHPGDSLAAAATALGVDPGTSGYFEAPAETGPELGPSRVPGQVNAPAVAVYQPLKDSPVVSISAPTNFGDGHDI
ncbi:hypothetical protein [Leifsonia poae]|uniref:hypothetical protein n=1 Tax=Leifsonia poae TaxID=110933 RepID=UPI003D67BFEA